MSRQEAIAGSQLSATCGKTGWLVHAWIVMDYHYHAGHRNSTGNLVAGMLWFQNTYTPHAVSVADGFCLLRRIGVARFTQEFLDDNHRGENSAVVELD
jgi:hypothetical protein